MSRVKLLLHQLRYENRSFWRNPLSVFFTFIFPLMFLVIFNGLFGEEVGYFGPPVSASNFYVPAIAAFSIVTACFTNNAITVAILRDEGILKRVRGTPLPAAAYLGARVIHSIFVGIILVAIVSLAGVFLYDVDMPDEYFWHFALIVIVGSATFCALGLAFTALIPNQDAAPPMTNASILPILFISNVFIPLENPPRWVEVLSEIFPVRHLAESTLQTFHPFEPAFEGERVLVLAAWGVAGLILAIRYFSWEPRR